MSEGRTAKRRQLVEMWASRYPRSIAELIAVVIQPFDDDDIALAATTVAARAIARRRVRGLFDPDQAAPSGGEIEAPLREIACQLLEVFRADPLASLPADRLAAALDALGDIGVFRRAGIVDELVVPVAAQRLDGLVPFAMWR